ncbi:MAG: nicotinate-nucleotide--dimethylbenzimidazole phosphoribosyltransferase [Methylomonas sp.]
MNWLFHDISSPDTHYYQQALERQTQLTKPPGSLGLLEDIAVRLAAMQHRSQPRLEKIHVSVFAADHGIAAEGVSAFPQAVTVEMVKNFAAGGAAVNVLARHVAADFEVVDVGLLQPVDLPNVIAERAGAGTANFRQLPAMTDEQLALALQAGKSAIARAAANGADLFIGGEMGIANTASASALAAALLNIPAIQITGAGTGLNAAQIEHKAAVIDAALLQHQTFLNSPLAILRHLGGFEIAALTAAYISAAQRGLPVLVDGFICSVAALISVKINPGCDDWFFYGHHSEEKGHKIVLKTLNARPLLNLNMRLGEASGAVTAVPILQMACRLHNEMATFAQANITTG